MQHRLFLILRIILPTLLITWGTVTLIAWLATPVHQAVLLSDAGKTLIATVCEGRGSICKGMAALLPFIDHTFGRMMPFLGYAIVTLLLFVGLLFKEMMNSGAWRLRIRVTPLAVLLSFLASLWLLFTVLGLGSNDDIPFARIVEPLPQLYESVSPAGLAALQENFDRLQARGCLTAIGEGSSGAEVFDISQLCFQKTFFTRVLPHALLLMGLLFLFLTLGRALLRMLRMPFLHPLTEMIFSAGLGACGLIVLLWGLALTGFYLAPVGWVLLLLLPALLYRDARYWVQSLRQRSWHIDLPWYDIATVLAWLIVSLLALNFLTVIRPFPIGWDDLGKYINQPRMLVSYGAMIPAMGTFLWEYLTSLGFLLFGFGDTFRGEIFGATFAMIINWAAGLLAVLAVYAVGRLYLGRKRGLLAALLYYALPMVGHFSFADMKVDNAVFFTGTLSVLAVLHAVFPPAEQSEEDPASSEDSAAVEDDTANGTMHVLDWRWLALAGMIGGFAFAMKPTSVMTLMAMGTVLFGISIHWTAFLGTMSIAWVLYGFQGRLHLSDISARIYGDPHVLNAPLMLSTLAVIGIALICFSFYLQPRRILPTLRGAGMFIAGFLLTIAPWLLWNNSAAGNLVPRLLFATPNTMTPTFVYNDTEVVKDIGQEIKRLPAELQIDRSQCVSTGSEEELDRYWGYRTGWSHYLTLPWRTVMNSDSIGYYVTTFPVLLLFPLLFLLPFIWSRRGRWLLWLSVGTLFMLAQWMLFANGILWYGLGMFLGMVIGLEALVARAPDAFSRTIASLFITLSLLSAFAMRMWQFEQQRNLVEYPLGKVTAQVIAERTIPDYELIQRTIEERRLTFPDRPYTYRMGTFIPYFIPRNIEALPISDSQLDLFNCLHRERDPSLTLRRLQAMGINGMIFDTNAQTIEADPNGSLHQKVQAFVDFVNTPNLGLTVLVFNPEGGIAYILLP